ncbi:DNA topoisomerase IB [Salinibacterium sp. TMP30]|uniref:DNA topoisomerase IB n=1 Tax=Salinibacterium sp. TMP30 TaxID=3138237 RepID=UPI003138A7D4
MPRLRRSDPSGLGYHRVRSGRGFSFRDPQGTTVVDRQRRERFMSLGIPPAWSDVWIAPYENGHIQATGLDAAGRRQYIYHPVWRERHDREKFDRALALAEALPSARAHVTRTLRSSDDAHERSLAAAFRMLDTGALRIGSERYADENGSRGLSTLLCNHVGVRGECVTLRFPAKSGQLWESEIRDADLATFVRGRLRAGKQTPLLSWREGSHRRSLSASDINDYVRERTGGEFTAKDFRTLRGSVAAASSLAVTGPAQSQRERATGIKRAMAAAAEVLGNTPAIARKSYVDPRIVDAYITGSTIDPRRLASAETELRLLLAPATTAI